MYAVERRQWLIERARSFGRLDVTELSDELQLAPETIRRDLNDLERQGMVRRVYGGAVPIERMQFESALSVRAQRRPAEKARIATAAIELIGTAEAIFIDEGQLPHLVAEHLAPNRPITVVTASLPIATELATRANVEVLMVGGRIRPKTLGAVDHWAVDMLRSVVLDLAFLGANGISVEKGLTATESSVAAVKAAALESSRRRICVADSSKFGTDSFVRFAGLADFEHVVTDSRLNDNYCNQIRAVGPEVTRA
jgi:DeoR family fructose operon transcriptional repressor